MLGFRLRFRNRRRDHVRIIGAHNNDAGDRRGSTVRGDMAVLYLMTRNLPHLT